MTRHRARARSLAAVLAVGGLLLAACGGDDDGGGGGGGSAAPSGGGGDLPACPVDALDAASADGPVEITFWHAMTTDNETALTTLTDTYNASQDKVHVTLLNQQSYEENFESYRTASAGDRPDLVQLPDYYVQAITDSGTIIPVQSCVDASDFDLGPLLDPAVQYYTLDGVLEGMPFNVSNPVLYYNKADFVAAGLDPDDPPTTLDELRADAQAIVDSGAATYGVALETGFDSGGGWFVEQWFASAGELYANQENGRDGRATEVLFDNQAGVDIFTYLQGLVDDGLAVNVGENASGTDNLFKLADASEPAAMTMNTSAAIAAVLNALGGGLVPGFGPDQLGIGPLPSPAEGGGVTVGGAALYLVKDQPDAEIAATWDYIQYLVSAQAQSTWADGTGYVPINEGAITLSPYADRIAADPRFRVAYDQLVGTEASPANAGPVLGPLRQVRGEVADALQDVLSGGADPAEALHDAAQASNALLEDYANRTGTG